MKDSEYIAEQAALIAEAYANLCDNRAEDNSLYKLPTITMWQMWKEKAHSARMVAELIRKRLITEVTNHG